MTGEDTVKIARNSVESVKVKVLPEELDYRSRYLPDPHKLTDEKLVCTVCSASLASDVHKGNEIFIHRSLLVLVCDACYNFYGDGCFSTDEDGDDKYCRWCGQGGTLYLCSSCTCAFCEKCVKLNLKPSVLADLEKDDWKCYICNPRPLFGCRAICWGAQELNRIGNAKEEEKFKKRQEKLNEKKKELSGRKSRKESDSENELVSKKRKRTQESDSSSPDVVSTKKPKRGADSKHMNGSISRSNRRKKYSSSDNESDENKKKVTRSFRNSTRKNKAPVDSSSEEEDAKIKTKKSKSKTIKKESESSDSEKKESKRKSSRKIVKNYDYDSSNEKPSKSKKSTKKKNEYFSDESDNEKQKKKRIKKKKKETSSEDSSDGDVRVSKKTQRKKKAESSESDSENERRKTKKKLKDNKHTSEVKGRKEVLDADNESKTEDNIAPTAETILVKKRIKLAVLWLSNVVKDISELGSLITVRATKFSNKRINTENLKTYEDVLNTVNKLKQLISGIHSNYDHIEKSLDGHLKPWKILTGLQEPDNINTQNEETVKNDAGDGSSAVTMEVAKESVSNRETTESDSGVNKSTRINEMESTINTEQEKEVSLQWSELSADDDSENETVTRDLISKANDMLDKEDIEAKDQESDDAKSDAEECVVNGASEAVENEVEPALKVSKPDKTSLSVNSSTEEKLHTFNEDSEEVPSEEEEEADKKQKKPEKDSNASIESNEDVKQKDKPTDKENKEKNESTRDYLLGILKDSDSNSDIEISPSMKSCPADENGESEDKSEGSSSDKKHKTTSRETSESPGVKTKTNDPNLKAESPSSSEDSELLKLFTDKLKKKWQSSDMDRNISHGSDLEKKLQGKESDKKDLKKKKVEEEKANVTQKDRNNKLKEESDRGGEKIKKKRNNEERSNVTQKAKNFKEKSKVKEESVSEKIRRTRKKAVAKLKITKETKSKKCLEGSELEESEDSDKDIKEEKKGIQNEDEVPNQQKYIDEEENCVESDDDVSKEDKKYIEGASIAGVEIDLQDFYYSEINCDGEGLVEIIKVEIPNEEDEDNSNIAEAADEDAQFLKQIEEHKTKFVGLDSSSEGEHVKKETVAKPIEKADVTGPEETKVKRKTLKKRSERKRPQNQLFSDSSDEEENKDLVTLSSDEENKKSEEEVEKDEDKSEDFVLLTSADSSDSEVIPQKKLRIKNKSSDSDVEISEEEKEKKTRKRIKCADSSEESGGSGESTDMKKKSSQGESPGKGGRKNIKKIKTKDDLADATKEAAEEEKERRRRIEERQKLFNQMFEMPETEVLDKLVLDFEPEDKKELISVHPDLVSKMKPHQAKGVKFMWDSCFESLSRLKTKKGSGCILAHCMGLGKTFQVISLVHTVLTHDDTQMHTVMVVCPLSTVLNWYNEFDKWLEGVEGGSDIEVFHLTKYKGNADRARELRRWQNNGGVLIIGYEMFRNLTCETSKRFRAKMKKDFQETLIDPGADLIVCDEGHMLKNETTALSKAMTRVKTLRRIVLTGTPMQNNLKEYHCMVQFVKPNLLGTRKEFLNRFVNPITNGQFVDSTEADVKVMKRRAHVLHKMLEGLVQRFDYNVLTPFLPPKHEYVIAVCLSELQMKLYTHYLENYSQQSDNTKAGSRLFQDWQALGRIWTHPRVLKMSTERANYLKEMKALENSDEEGSLKDFIEDGSGSETTEESSDGSSSGASIKSAEEKKKPAKRSSTTTRSMRSNAKRATHLDSEEEEKEVEPEVNEVDTTAGAWWSDMVEPQHFEDINQSAKLVLLFAILRECEMIEDKMLVFSQSLFSLNLIEYFLDKIDEATQQGRIEENLGNHQGSWSKGLDYFRLDGSTSSENRNIWCKAFNREDNPRARLFLISTRAGGLGINLTGANRVIIFDASWNPSHDVQSIFRIYRFGQKKPCYVYRFIAHGTMEEKVYDRQVAKQSMSNRVVDEQQVHRHFSMNDLNELYTYTPPSKKEDRPTPALPKDNLMAEILAQFSDWIEKYHEHDSMLENVVEEELNEEERKLAWEDYENDKKRAVMPATTGSGVMYNPMNREITMLRHALKAKYPDKPENEINQLLVYQVSVLMKQQQQLANMMQQPMPNAGMFQTLPSQQQPFIKNLAPGQMFNYPQQQFNNMQYIQQLQMQNQQASILPKKSPKMIDYQKQMMMQHQANLARQQMLQLQQQGMYPQNTFPQMMNQPQMNNSQAALEIMKQNYTASRQMNPAANVTQAVDGKEKINPKT